MTEVRVTSETGGAKGVKPQRMDLVPWDAIMQASEVYAFGAIKYEDHNWRRGYAWSLSFGAMMRHWAAWWQGEELDPESGLPHTWHAWFHTNALIVFQRDFPEYDDRFKPEVKNLIPNPSFDHSIFDAEAVEMGDRLAHFASELAARTDTPPTFEAVDLTPYVVVLRDYEAELLAQMNWSRTGPAFSDSEAHAFATIRVAEQYQEELAPSFKEALDLLNDYHNKEVHDD